MCSALVELRPYFGVVSYDFAIWKRHAQTKTAMLADVYAAILEGQSHPAMGDFDAQEFINALQQEFPAPAPKQRGLFRRPAAVDPDAEAPFLLLSQTEGPRACLRTRA